MSTEKLKVIAEGMRWSDIHTQHLNGRYVILGIPNDCSMQEEYDPLTNNDQDSELEEKLCISTSFINKDLWQAQIGIEGGCGRGSTPREARCNAAYEYFKQEN